MKATFVIPGDNIYAYREFGQYYSVMYMAKDGRQVIGWVDKKGCFRYMRA